jgi:adenylate cyclase
MALTVLLVLAALGALAGCIAGWRRWRAARRELDRVRNLFARYVAPSVVDVLLARKDERLFTGRAVTATVLVCRIRNFAQFVEDLSPEQTLRYLNEFYALTGTAIQRNRGIIETFLGDGIVAVFGVPLENPIQEDDALRASLEIVRNVVAMRQRWARQHRKPFTVGIGVNTGNMIAGDAGFRDRREFTVVGPEAMFAHRLQEAAFALNAFIVASRKTCDVVTEEYQLVPISGIPLAGVRRLLDAFVVRGHRRGAERFTVPVDAMVETTIEPTPEAAPTTATANAAFNASATSAQTAGASSLQPAPPEPPLARPRPRPRPAAASTASELNLPELRHGWRFGDDDAESFLPEPPPRRATYEDSAGPPLDL